MLFDGNFAAVAHAVGVLDVQVAPGLYELQYKAGRSVQEQTVRVRGGLPSASFPFLSFRPARRHCRSAQQTMDAS